MRIMSSRKSIGNIIVQITNDFKDIEVATFRLKKLVKTICNRFKLSAANISIALVDDAEICKINKRFLNRSGSTDCLSFDLSDRDIAQALKLSPGRGNSKLSKIFEVVVNAERAIKEAAHRGHSGEAEVALYIVHGMLHELGFDDSTPYKAKKMHETEDQILQQFGYGVVYNTDEIS